MDQEQLSPVDEPIEGLDDLETPEATSSDATATDSTQDPQAAPAEPAVQAEPTYEIGGKTYSESELRASLDDATNARKFIAEATQRSQEAKKIMNDPRYAQAVEVLELLEDPAIAARFETVYAQATGKVPLNAPGYDPAVPALRHELTALKQQIAEVAGERNESEAGRCVSAFAQWVKEEYGKELAPDEVQAWVEQTYIPNTSDEVRGYDDNLEYMKFHWDRTNGREVRAANVAAMRDQIRDEVVKSLRDGQNAALVTPTDHQEIPFKPKGLMDDVMDEAFEAARADPNVILDGTL
jgi:hypothetical protein